MKYTGHSLYEEEINGELFKVDYLCGVKDVNEDDIKKLHAMGYELEDGEWVKYERIQRKEKKGCRYENLDDERLTNKLEKLYKALDVFVKATGLEYDGEEDEYIMSKVKDDDYDREMLASIENAHADLKYFLSK
jgi:hypothetical protein